LNPPGAVRYGLAPAECEAVASVGSKGESFRLCSGRARSHSLVQGRAHPLARATERTSTPSVVATAEWVLWVGIVRPYSAIGMRTPAEHEAAWASDTNQDRK